MKNLLEEQDMINKTNQINNYAFLLACIRSGQVSERQLQEHLKDEIFHAYFKNHLIITEGNDNESQSG